MPTLLIALFVFLQPAPQASPDLATVLQRGTEYVVHYQAELGNLIGTEDYTQTAKWKAGDESLPAAQSMKTMRRRTSSDFMILHISNDWVSLREVNVVDGQKIKSDQPPAETAFTHSPADNTAIFKSIRADSSKYNIGGVLREDNLPTFALQVLNPDEVSRFSFKKDNTETLNGIPAWRIQFHENKPPALVATKKGEDLLASGTLWIVPDTGQVLKTEFIVDDRFARPAIHSGVTVTYAKQTKGNMLLPGLMTEHYEAGGPDHTIDCRATYSNFHPFTVDVKFEPGTLRP